MNDNPTEEQNNKDQQLPNMDASEESLDSHTTLTEQPAVEKNTTIEKTKKQISPKKVLLFLAIVLLATGVAIFIILRNKEKTDNHNQQNIYSTSESTAQQNITTEQATPEIPPTVLSDNNYFSEYKVLGNLNFYRDPESFFGYTDESNTEPNVTSSQFIYRQIGITADNRQIIVYTNNRDDFGGVVWEFALGKDDNYSLLDGVNPNVGASSPANDAWYAEKQKALSDNVTIDRVTTLAELKFPQETRIKGQPIEGPDVPYYLENGRNTLTDSASELTSLGETDGIEILRAVSRDEPTYQLITFFGVFKNLFAGSYSIKGEVSSATDNEINISWSKGESTKAKYYSQGPGCGTGGYILPKNVKTADLVLVGTTPKGQKLYQLASAHPFTQYLYNEDYDKTGEFNADQSLSNLTIDQFADKHAYFLIENSLGEYMAFVRQDMFIRGGCGKPVIYLYPMTETVVDVTVGADIVISEPFYEKNGWQNILARPDGNLTYRNKTYSSLYWEGYGFGPYPDLSKVGRIVTQASVKQEILSDLIKLGLNEKERADFMEFWGPRIPKNPYVKLSWLNTAQMDQLAPLQVQPAPQTSIRVFLEFEGLDEKIPLNAQKLTSLPRRGFTLIEWGGLLREGIR